MNKSTPHYKEILVNNEPFIIPSEETLDGMLGDPDFLGLPLYVPETLDLLTALSNFIQKNRKVFVLGLSQYQNKIWLPMALFKLNGNWQRVHIEYPKCSECGWRGAIANPTEPSLYFGVPSRFDVLRQACSLPRLGCPVCGSILSRHAIWVEQ
ncbi:MAG: hypothetical protein FWG40_03420 [Peptococcaceae bacterium]|nr:hypothetical protein [Peptococcaceae bacterium]